MNARDLFAHWDEVRQRLFQALERLTDAQLSFAPRPGLRSLGETALHIANAEEGWFRHIVRGELAEWPPEYTLREYPTVQAVREALARVHARTEAYLAEVDMADLDRPIATPWGSPLPLRWIIWHVLEHEIHHRGEIFLMLGLLGLEAPEI